MDPLGIPTIERRYYCTPYCCLTGIAVAFRMACSTICRTTELLVSMWIGPISATWSCSETNWPLSWPLFTQLHYPLSLDGTGFAPNALLCLRVWFSTNASKGELQRAVGFPPSLNQSPPTSPLTMPPFCGTGFQWWMRKSVIWLPVALLCGLRHPRTGSGLASAFGVFE